LELEHRDLAALRNLGERGATNPKELGDADSRVKIATARLEQAGRDEEAIASQIALLRIRLDDTTVTAPFDGVIVAKHTEQGQWVAEGDPIAEVVSVGAFRAWLDVPQRFTAAVSSAEAEVSVQIEATGRITSPARPTVVRLVDRTARSMQIYFRVDDPDSHLAPGMSVTGWVPTGTRGDFLTIPRDALLRNDAGFFVYAARSASQGPSQAVPAGVDVLFYTGRRVAVRTDALHEGDMVVVEGNERLCPMMPIAFEATDGQQTQVP
jgi:RND family efflux transporter MFP subunit